MPSVGDYRSRRLGADTVMLYPMYRVPNFDDLIETLRRFKEVASG